MGSSVGSATVRTGQSNNVGSSQAVKDAPETKSTESSSSQEPTSANGGSDPRGKIAEHQLEGQMRNAQLMATAEREMNPVAPNQPVDITNKDMRTQLLRSSPQINPVSNAATTVDGVHANSQGYDQKTLNKSFVQGGPPAGLVRGTEDWRNEIWLNTAQQPAELHAHIKGPDDKGKEHQYLMIDTGKYDTQEVSELDFALRTGTRKVSE